MDLSHRHTSKYANLTTSSTSDVHTLYVTFFFLNSLKCRYHILIAEDFIFFTVLKHVIIIYKFGDLNIMIFVTEKNFIKHTGASILTINKEVQSSVC